MEDDLKINSPSIPLCCNNALYTLVFLQCVIYPCHVSILYLPLQYINYIYIYGNGNGFIVNTQIREKGQAGVELCHTSLNFKFLTIPS